MFAVLGLLLGVALWLGCRQRPPRRLPLGKPTARKSFVVDGCRYDVEEVRFADYQAAIHGYFNLVPVVLSLGKVCEERYDFFDFYSVAVRFEDSSARFLRLVDRVRLVQSDRPVPLDELERNIQSFAYGDLK